jgi:hypothetical protein
LEDNLTTDYFDLDRGNAQGDTISPFIFNLCYQILLFKLQYDLQIDSIAPEIPLPASHPPLPETVSTALPRVYGLADDATVLTTMEVGSLSRIKDILVSFGNISGLECNVDKTILMQVGSDSNIDQAILDLGFDVKREITLLGLIIENDTGNFQKSLSKITNTIKKEINFWIRFNLSLPGRIASVVDPDPDTDPDPVGSGTFCRIRIRIRIRNKSFRIRIRPIRIRNEFDT